MNLVRLLFLFTAFALISCGKGESEQKKNTTDTLAILVTKVQDCSRLYTSEYHIHKIITHQDQLKLKGTFFGKDFDADIPFGERNIAIPMDVILKGYIDFGKFTVNHVKREGNNIEIILPDPQVVLTSSMIDHDRVVESVPFLRSDFSDKELSAYEKQGREAILQNISRLGIIEKTKESAAKLLIPLIAQSGFPEENITISFRKDFNERDVSKMIEFKHPGK